MPMVEARRLAQAAGVDLRATLVSSTEGWRVSTGVTNHTHQPKRLNVIIDQHGRIVRLAGFF
jgi:hypothetical protein